MLMLWFRLELGTERRSHYSKKEKRDTSSIWNKHVDTEMDELLLAQTSHFDPAHEWSVDILRAETLPHSSCCCSIFLSHYVVAATRFLVNAPALRDGPGFTVMRPALLDTTGKDACCPVAAPMEPTAILSQATVYVPLGSWWVSQAFTAI